MIGSKSLIVRQSFLLGGIDEFWGPCLSCAWAGVPGVIGYRAHPITYLIGKLLVGVPFLGMANLLLPDNPPNSEFYRVGQMERFSLRKFLKYWIIKILGRMQKKTAGQLHELLVRPQNQGIVEG